MGERDEFDPRLKAYLQRDASTPPPAGMEARILGGAPRRKLGWALQSPPPPPSSCSPSGWGSSSSALVSRSE